MMPPEKWSLLEKMRVVVAGQRLGQGGLDELLRQEALTRAEYERFREETKDIFARAKKNGVRCW